jgi:hypothetical protein
VKAAPKTAEVTADNGLGLDGLCDYRYEVALGEAPWVPWRLHA